jgi:hypothetical protein
MGERNGAIIHQGGARRPCPARRPRPSCIAVARRRRGSIPIALAVLRLIVNFAFMDFISL